MRSREEIRSMIDSGQAVLGIELTSLPSHPEVMTGRTSM